MANVVEETVNSVSDSLGKLSKSLSGGGAYKFPDDLGSRAVVFSVQKRERDTTRVTTSKKTGATIALPIPTNLSTGYNAQYTQTGLGVLGAAAQGAFNNPTQSVADYVTSGEAMEDLGAQARSILASASPEVAALIGGAMGGAVGLGVGAAAAGVARGALAGAGLAVNPHLAVLFEGVGFRNHSFQYKFSPRSSSESNTIKNIIYEFKNAMLPSKEDLAFFNYPDEFNIRFPFNEEYLFKIGTSVLTDFQINYNPDGGSYFHQNGAPVSVSLSLQFTELDILTKSEIAEGR